jgi:sugar phosphate isomerase/epimerase
MSGPSRRSLVKNAVAIFPAAHALLHATPLRAGNLGVQLYTVRNVIGKDPAATLQAIEKIGYKEVEVTYANLDQIWPALKQTSMKPVSAHVDLKIFSEGGDHLDQALGSLKERGFRYAVVPYVPPEQRGGIEVFKKLAATLNRSAERAKKHGLSLCYHNHAFEFEPLANGTGLELLMTQTDKKLVSLEMDVFWVSVAGHDPVELLKTYSGRVALLHCKDKIKGFPTQYNEKVPPTTFKEVGNGSLDFNTILAAADKAGVQHYFVEQDQTPGDPITSLHQSYQHLSSHFGA